MMVDELRAVVGIDAEKGEREAAADALEAGEDMFLGLVENGGGLGPAGSDISAKVRTGICRLSRLPGRVMELPWGHSRLRSALRRRSTVEGLTFLRSPNIASLQMKEPEA